MLKKLLEVVYKELCEVLIREKSYFDGLVCKDIYILEYWELLFKGGSLFLILG